MKQTYSILLLLFALTSCNGQVTRKNAKSEQSEYADEKIARYMADLRESIAAGIDPYFVETSDTVSVYGPKCITRDVVCDRNGNIWLASWAGIIKYDGKVFTNYTLKEDLRHFHVLSCYEDKMGNLWFGTARGGMYKYDGNTFTFFTKKDGLADSTITCFAEDRDGNMWFGTECGGVSRYDPDAAVRTGGKKFTNFTTKDGLCSNNVSSIIQDKTGKIWFGCLGTTVMEKNGGITCYDPDAAARTGGKSFTKFTGKDSTSFKGGVTSLLEDKSGNIWIGQFSGLTVYDPDASVGTGGKTFTDHLTKCLTYYIIEDKAGNIWLTHVEPAGGSHPQVPNQMLYRYDPDAAVRTGGKEFTKVAEKYGLDDCQLFGKAADSAGNIWFGTMKGVCRYDGKSFTYFTK